MKPEPRTTTPPLADALAGLLARLDATAPASLWAATRLLVALELRGHTRLPLEGGARAALAEAGLEAQPWARELPADATAAQRAWAVCSLVAVEPGGDTAAPLVLQHGALALRRHWQDERRAAVLLRERLLAPPVAGDRAALAPLLDALFPPRPGTTPADDAQRRAAAVAVQGRVAVINGGPGTGKTWTAARVLVLLQALHGAEPLRLALAAPTGKAAARLRQSIEAALQPGAVPVPAAIAQARVIVAAALAAQPARTLHATLGGRPGTRRFAHAAGNPLPVDLLLVDEASMVHGEMLAAMLEALPARARLVLLGDRDQLASVEAGAVMAELCAAGSPLAPQTVTLTAGHRFDGPIAELAAATNHGNAAAARALFDAGHEALRLLPLPTSARTSAATATPLLALAAGEQGHGPFVALQRQRPAGDAGFEAWAAALLRALDGFRLLAALREGPLGVATLNARLTDALGFRPGADGWFEGRPVMVTRNEPQLGVFNGDVGVALGPPGGGALRVWFLDGATLRSVAASRLAAVETAWAMTVHKSQGSEFGHVALVLPGEDSPVLTRELVYTGITRARRRLTLAGPQPALLAQALARCTRRFSGLGDALRRL
jgi:exodeoxyribonuclease V alpha subunit